MEENQPLVGKERAFSFHPSHSESKLDSEGVESKKQNCLCAPTTHAGSFRCRLHRRPPPSLALLSQHAVKKGLVSQKTLAPKIKLALHHKLRLGYGKRAPFCSTSSCRQQELPGLSRLSKTSSPVSTEQVPSSWSDTEAVTTVWKTSIKGDETLASVSQISSSELQGEELSSAKKSYIRPLLKLPSI